MHIFSVASMKFAVQTKNKNQAMKNMYADTGSPGHIGCPADACSRKSAALSVPFQIPANRGAYKYRSHTDAW